MDRQARVNRNNAQVKTLSVPFSIESVSGKGYRIVVIINGVKYYATLSKDPS